MRIRLTALAQRLVLPGLALAVLLLGAPTAVLARHDAAVAIDGTAISRLPDDTRKLTISAAVAGDAQTTGFVYFRHLAPLGLSAFRGTVTCLSVDTLGTVQVSGTVDTGVTATGVVLDGRDFAFTIQPAGAAPAFSLPLLAPGGTLPPCGGGRTDVPAVPVTEGALQVVRD